MKKFIYLITVVLLVSACIKDPDFNSYTIALKVILNEEITGQIINNAKVTLINLQKGYTIQAYMDSTGLIAFNAVEPGFYAATLSHSYAVGPFTQNLNGTLEIMAFSSVNETIPVVMSTSNALVIKEYYYSSSITPAGNQYSSDQFIEIYNNSEDIVYIDGLSIIEHESYGISTNFWANLTDKFAVRMIWTFPGDGDDYPINPGSSVVIARDAFNHKSDPNGNPLAPVDLGNANFEFWVDMPSGSDIDNFTSPNMIEDLFTFRGSDVVFHVQGGSAIALVDIALDPVERKNYIDNNLVRKEISSSRWYGLIANDMVVDAVEVVFDEARAVYKRFPVVVDAGYTYVPSGSKSGKGLRRKIKSITEGRTVYQDTNNSTEDFIKDVTPKPWIYE